MCSFCFYHFADFQTCWYNFWFFSIFYLFFLALPKFEACAICIFKLNWRTTLCSLLDVIGVFFAKANAFCHFTYVPQTETETAQKSRGLSLVALASSSENLLLILLVRRALSTVYMFVYYTGPLPSFGTFFSWYPFVFKCFIRHVQPHPQRQNFPVQRFSEFTHL